MIAALGCAALLLECGGDQSGPPVDQTPPVTLQGGSLSVQAIAWNRAQVPVGKVAAVADGPQQAAVFSDLGVSVFGGGALLGGDDSVKSWVGAASVPALALSGTWLVGLDRSGHLYRMQNQTTAQDVTALYGLTGRTAREIVALGAGLVAFAWDGGVGVTDGQKLWTYPLALTGLVGGGGRVAARTSQGIQVLDPRANTTTLLPLAGAVAAGFDPAGKVVAATAQALYRERAGVLDKVLDTSGEPVHGLVTAGTGVWVALGDHLGLWRGDQILRGPSGQQALGGVAAAAALGQDARLWGSVTGDVWVDSGGQLSRVSESGGGADKDLWQQTVLPVFQQACASCHLPGGSSKIDLSTYQSWVRVRSAILARVVDQKPTPMPPTGAELTAAQVAAIGAWAQRQ